MSVGGAIGGAGTGAKVGSMIAPGIGTGIGAGLGALVGWLTGRKKKKTSLDLPPELQALLQQQIQRQQAQGPLFEAVQQRAFGRLPANVRAGLPTPTVAPFQPTGDPMRDLLALQQSRQSAQNPLYEAVQRLAQQRMGMTWR